MLQTLAELLNVTNEELKKLGVLNVYLNYDSGYYINIKLLEKTDNPFFKSSYSKILEHFNVLYDFLKDSKKEGDTFWKAAFKMFNYPEVNEVCIGLAKGKFGKGLTSKKLRIEILRNAKEIIDSGNVNDKIFLYLEIFSEKVGVDLFSDMIANIILEDIKNYTRHINQTLNKENEYYINEVKNKKVYYLPLEILSDIPTPKFMCDIDSCITKNQEVKNHMNDIIGSEWRNRTSEEKKRMVSEMIKNDPKVYSEFSTAYENDETELYDFNSDKIGSTKLPEIAETFFTTSHSLGQNVDIMKFFDEFKDKMENNNGASLLYENGKIRRETYCQTFLQIGLQLYYRNNEIDISRECNLGRGPLDFKIVTTNQKFALEIKKFSNPQIIHGIQTQLPEYAKAEKIENLIYVVFDDIENSDAKYKKINLINSIANDLPYKVEVIYIDVRIKKSASLYEGE